MLRAFPGIRLVKGVIEIRINHPFDGIFYGWWVVCGGFIIQALPSSLYNILASIFFLPMSKTLGLTRARTSFVFSLSRAQGAFSGPVVGYAVDRWGPGRMVLLGGLITGLGYLLLARVDSYLTLLIVYLGVISLGHNVGFMHTALTAVNSWFIRRRGFAMGLMGSAIGVGGAITAPIMGVVVHSWGWQTAAVIAAIIVFVTAIPTSFLFRGPPERMGLLPDGDHDPGGDVLKLADPILQTDFSLTGWEYTTPQALKTKTFWWLLLAITLRLAVNHTMSIHFIPMMMWKGVGPRQAAVLLGMVGLLNIPLRVILGILGDIYQKGLVMAVSMAVGVGAIVFLAYHGGAFYHWVFVLIYAIPDSTGTLNWSMIGEHFGRRNFGTIRGMMNLFYGWGTALFPIIGGIIFDRYGDYVPVLWLLAVTWAVAALVFAGLRRPVAL